MVKMVFDLYREKKFGGGVSLKILLLKQAEEQILFQEQPSKMLNKKNLLAQPKFSEALRQVKMQH